MKESSFCLDIVIHDFLIYLNLPFYICVLFIADFGILQSMIGEKLVNFLVEPKKGTKWPKELPKFKSRPDAIAVCKDLCSRQFIHRSEKVAKGELEVRTIMFE